MNNEKKTGFAALGVKPELIELLHKQGINEPTPVQNEAIPRVLSGTDLIVQAQTGSGKTLAFVLPMLETLQADKTHVQGLVLSPSRELAAQITSELELLAPAVEASVMSVYGGKDVDRQLNRLKEGVQFIVATPGRLLDHLKRGTVLLHKVQTVVIDEADQMLQFGFLEEIEEILRQTNSRRQTLLFSATLPQPVRHLARDYMRTPQELLLQSRSQPAKEIKQELVRVTDDAGKVDTLVRLIGEHSPYLALVFCHTKQRVVELTDVLLGRGVDADELHGDLSQAKREQAMRRFREAKVQVLVATDLAARGLDVEGVTHVYNYDIPHDAATYVHRIGRTGRAGETGLATTLAGPRDQRYVELIAGALRGGGWQTPPRGAKARAGGSRPAGRGGAIRGAAAGGNRDAATWGTAAGGERGAAARGAAAGGERGTAKRGAASWGAAARGAAAGDERGAATRGAVAGGKRGAAKRGAAAGGERGAAKRGAASWGAAVGGKRGAAAGRAGSGGAQRRGAQSQGEIDRPTSNRNHSAAAQPQARAGSPRPAGRGANAPGSYGAAARGPGVGGGRGAAARGPAAGRGRSGGGGRGGGNGGGRGGSRGGR